MLALSACLSTAHAGAWGDGAFDNDAAQDWLAECARTRDLGVAVEAVDMAQMASFIDADDGAAAVAAAEVLAAAVGGGAPAPCVAAKPAGDLRALASRARQALARVADRNTSELAQQWADEKRNRWADNVARLAARLP